MIAYVYLLTMPLSPAPWPLAGLDAADLERARRFRRPEDQACFVAGRMLLARLLADHANQPWSLIIGAHGRPRLAGPSSATIDINISHCAGLVAAALVRHGRIGVDVEATTRLVDGDGLAGRYFSRKEARAIAAATPSERARTFLRYWTAKEAALKAIGQGLLIPLDQVSVGDDFRSLQFHAMLGEDGGEWQLITRDFATHVLAVAVSGRNAAAAELRERWLTRADLGA